MDFLGPIGLTIATAWLFEKGLRFVWFVRDRVRGGFDYRLVFLGAVLPDLIDKPVGFWIAPEIVNNSLRSVGHSLPFMAASLPVVWGLTRRRGLWPVAGFALALSAHLVFDQMWQMPRALFWPVLGWSFPEGTVPLTWWLHVHFAQPAARLPDLIGTAILAVAAMRAAARGARWVWQRPQIAR